MASADEMLQQLGSLPGFRAELLDEPVFDGQIFVIEAGPADAPAVVLVHGIGDNAALDWSGLLAHLASVAPQHRVLAFDLPGFGRSTRANMPYSPDRYARIVSYLVEHRLGARPVSLIGHSMGGAVCIQHAARHAADLERLILVDVAGILHRHAYGEYLVQLGIQGIPGLDGVTGGLVETIAHSLLRPLARLEPNPYLLFELAKVRQKVLKGDPVKIAALMMMLTNFGPAIGAIRTPPLVIWGDRDNIAPLRTGKLLAARIPGAALEILEGCGHVPMKDAPERFTRLVDDRLDEPPRSVSSSDGKIPPLSSERVERFVDQRGLRISGEFDRLELEGCKGALLLGVRTRSLCITKSDVAIEHSVVDGREVGLELNWSQVEVTGGSISGDVAIFLGTEANDLDLAGVVIQGRQAAVRALLETEVLLSVCPVSSPGRRGDLHGIFRVSPEKDL